jgi:hypothetical protein
LYEAIACFLIEQPLAQLRLCEISEDLCDLAADQCVLGRQSKGCACFRFLFLVVLSVTTNVAIPLFC